MTRLLLPILLLCGSGGCHNTEAAGRAEPETGWGVTLNISPRQASVLTTPAPPSTRSYVTLGGAFPPPRGVDGLFVG
ncbi:MAG: hypothetical protein H7836_12230 [Magnetococcus sp. YQC-3]